MKAGSSDAVDLESYFLSPEEVQEHFKQRRQWLEAWPNPLLRRVVWEQEWVERIMIYAACEAYQNAIAAHKDVCPTMDAFEFCHCVEMQAVHETCEVVQNIMVDDLETDDPLEDPRQTSWWRVYQGRE